jgi:hypothetical protein
MKNLSKIKLEDVVVLSDLQMKLVKGGEGKEGELCTSSSKTCKVASDCGPSKMCIHNNGIYCCW